MDETTETVLIGAGIGGILVMAFECAVGLLLVVFKVTGWRIYL